MLGDIHQAQQLQTLLSKTPFGSAVVLSQERSLTTTIACFQLLAQTTFAVNFKRLAVASKHSI